MTISSNAALIMLTLIAGFHEPRSVPQQSCPLSALYSERAIHRLRSTLQFRLYQQRTHRLERVRVAIRRGLPLDELLKGSEPNKLKQMIDWRVTHCLAPHAL